MAKQIVLRLIVGVLCLTGYNDLFAEQAVSEPVVSVTVPHPKTPNPKVYFHLGKFPKNQEILCAIHRPIFGKKTELPKFKINDLGRIIHSDNKESETLEMSAQGFLQGENVTASFYTDGKVITSISLIPRALVSEIKDSGLSLTAKLVCINPITNYDLKIQGLQEGEKFIFKSKSGTELIEHEVIYGTENGVKGFGISPDVIGQLGGAGELRIITKKGTLFLQLPWGYRLFDASN